MEHEISGRGALLDNNGSLREPGWARGLVLDYDRKAIKARKSRIKEWDYYCILAGDAAFAFTIDDNAYMGLLSVSVLDFRAGGEVTEGPMSFMPMGRTNLPPSSAAGVSEARIRDCEMRFEAKDGVRAISVKWPGYGAASKGEAERLFGGRGIEAELTLREKAPRESMVIATPWAGHPRAFYYNQKINCQEVSGTIKVGTRTFELSPDKAFAVLDWGRGVWTWNNTWLWGSSSGLARLEGARTPVSFGFNIGYGFGDTSAASENMVFVEGAAHKIGKLSIDLDDADFMKPWHARSEDGRFDLVLTPKLDRAATTDLLVLASIQHQVFGTWAGKVALEDGRTVEVEGLLGFCEKVTNRW